MRRILSAVACSCLLLLAACGGISITREAVVAASTEVPAGQEIVEGRPGLNVKVLYEIPDRPYTFIGMDRTQYVFEHGSSEYRKIERRNLVKELRRWAGGLGANAVIIRYTDKVVDRGGALALGHREEQVSTSKYNRTYDRDLNVVKTSDKQVEYAEAYAIFLH